MFASLVASFNIFGLKNLYVTNPMLPNIIINTVGIMAPKVYVIPRIKPKINSE